MSRETDDLVLATTLATPPGRVVITIALPPGIDWLRADAATLAVLSRKVAQALRAQAEGWMVAALEHACRAVEVENDGP